MSINPSTRELCSFFFSPVETGLFKCNICGNQRKQAAGTGYSNLLSHLAGKHPRHADDYAEFQRRAIPRMEVFGFVDPDTSNMYDWMRYVVERNLPLAEVDNKLTRQLVKMRPTCAETLKKKMRHVAKRVGEKIAGEMGQVFGLMFDGWSAGPLHFVALIAVYEQGGERQQRLLALSNLEDGQTADAHIEYVVSVLAIYGKDLANVKFLIGDNCSTNQSMATKLGVPLVGCASHRFNLAVIRFISEPDDIVSRVQVLMTQLRQPNNAAVLSHHTAYRVVRANATRWSSVFEMLDRYLVIREAIQKVPAVEELMPRGAMQRRIVALHTKLVELDSVCKKLQAEKRTLADVRLLFDACLEKYPSMEGHLKASANIVHSPVFEAAVVKATNEVPLSSAEAKSLEPFVQPVEASAASEQEESDFATRILRLAKKPRRSERAAAHYMPLVAMIPPTSNRCERLFSQCNFVLTPHRSALLPANFEMIMFLKANREMWNASTLLNMEE